MAEIVPVERMDVPQMIARSQYWTGWCIDNEIDNSELVRLRFLLQAVTAHLQDERDRLLEQSPGIPWASTQPSGPVS